MPPSPRPSPIPVFAWLQTVVVMALAIRFVPSLGPESPLNKIYLVFSWLSWIALCALLLTTFLRPLNRFPKTILALAAIVSSAIAAYFYLDAPTYRALAMHGGMLLVRLAEQGTADPVIALWHPRHLILTYAGFLLLSAILAVTSAGLMKRGITLRYPSLKLLAVMALLFGADRTYASFLAYTGRHWLQGQSAAFPTYMSVSANRLVSKFTAKPPPTANRRADLHPGLGLTTYRETVSAPPARKPNIVVILNESWRRDVLNENFTPILNSLRPEFLEGRRHASGGNATRYGLYSLFYGLQAASIDRMRAEKRGPYLFQSLKQAGYNIHILPGQTLDILGSAETIFVDVAEKITEPRFHRSALCDLEAFYKARKIIRETPPEKPYFIFLFFSSTHARYDFLPGFGPWPLIRRADGTTVPLAKRKRYENSLYFVDYLEGNLVRELKQRPDWQNTLLMITGDHGEEFQEHGHDMHGWSFNEEQTAVPFLAHFPGQTTGAVLDSLTTHADVVPTIMHYLGDTRPLSEYSDGRIITDAAPRLIMQQDWRAQSMFDGTERLTFYGSSIEFWQPIKVTDDHAEPRPVGPFLARHRDEIVRLLHEQSRFFQYQAD